MAESRTRSARTLVGIAPDAVQRTLVVPRSGREARRALSSSPLVRIDVRAMGLPLTGGRARAMRRRGALAWWLSASLLTVSLVVALAIAAQRFVDDSREADVRMRRARSARGRE